MAVSVQINWNLLWQRLRYYVQKYVLKKNIQRSRYFIVGTNNQKASIIYRKLIELGYVPNQICFYEPEQRYSVRTTFWRGIELWQRHIRVFDNEIRGHEEIAYDEGYGGNAERHYNGTTMQELPGKYKEEIWQLIYGKEVDGGKKI
jgi:hypothetical protein